MKRRKRYSKFYRKEKIGHDLDSHMPIAMLIYELSIYCELVSNN